MGLENLMFARAGNDVYFTIYLFFATLFAAKNDFCNTHGDGSLTTRLFFKPHTVDFSFGTSKGFESNLARRALLYQSFELVGIFR